MRCRHGAAMTFPLLKRALVTGGAKRIGRAIALALARDGFAVAIHYRGSAAEAEATAVEIRAQGVAAAALQADLTREAETLALASGAAAALGGPLGVLVNNASLFERDEALTATRESWDRHIETNLRAPFVLAQALAGGLPSGSGGAIVNLVDQRVLNLTPHFTSYTLSKAGLWTLTQTLALALAPRIRVNAIGPGPTVASERQTAAQFARQVERTPLHRGASPEEIGAAVRFILGQPAMTGQLIALDGGQHLDWSAAGPGSSPEE